MTKTEIILETVEYYKNNDRGLSPFGDCVYLSKEGNMCAVGRCLVNPGDIESDITIQKLSEINNDFNFLFKEDYQGHNVYFWQNLQNFHDDDRNWKKYKNKKGYKLTIIGKENLKQLLKKYAAS